MDNDPLAPFRREPRPVSKDDQAQEPRSFVPMTDTDLEAAAALMEAKPQIVNLLHTFKDFIDDAEKEHGVKYWAIKTDIEQVLNKIDPGSGRALEEARQAYEKQDTELGQGLSQKPDVIHMTNEEIEALAMHDIEKREAAEWGRTQGPDIDLYGV